MYSLARHKRLWFWHSCLARTNFGDLKCRSKRHIGSQGCEERFILYWRSPSWRWIGRSCVRQKIHQQKELNSLTRHRAKAQLSWKKLLYYIPFIKSMRHLKPNHSTYTCRNIQQLKLTLKKNCSNFLPVTIRRAIFGSPMTVFET